MSMIDTLSNYRIVNKNDYSHIGHLHSANETIKELNKRLDTEAKINTNLANELGDLTEDLNASREQLEEIQIKLGKSFTEWKIECNSHVKSKKERNFYMAFFFLSMPSLLFIAYEVAQDLIN